MTSQYDAPQGQEGQIPSAAVANQPAVKQPAQSSSPQVSQPQYPAGQYPQGVQTAQQQPFQAQQPAGAVSEAGFFSTMSRIVISQPKPISLAALLGIIGSFVVILGCFFPFVTGLGEAVNYFGSGTGETGDGVLLVIFMIAVIAFMVISKKGTAIAAIVLSALTFLIPLYDISRLPAYSFIHKGSGFYLVMLGSLVVLFGSIVQMLLIGKGLLPSDANQYAAFTPAPYFGQGQPTVSGQVAQPGQAPSPYPQQSAQPGQPAVYAQPVQTMAPQQSAQPGQPAVYAQPVQTMAPQQYVQPTQPAPQYAQPVQQPVAQQYVAQPAPQYAAQPVAPQYVAQPAQPVAQPVQPQATPQQPGEQSVGPQSLQQ